MYGNRWYFSPSYIINAQHIHTHLNTITHENTVVNIYASYEHSDLNGCNTLRTCIADVWVWFIKRKKKWKKKTHQSLSLPPSSHKPFPTPSLFLRNGAKEKQNTPTYGWHEFSQTFFKLFLNDTMIFNWV